MLGIDNGIALSDAPIPSDVADRIKNAFQRAAIINDSLIEVSNVGHTVYLDGKAESLAQYCEYPKGILVVPHDYGPLWVYEVPEAEQRELANEIEAIRQELKEPAP